MWGYILTAFVFFVGGAWAMFRFLEISAKRNERKEKLFHVGLFLNDTNIVTQKNGSKSDYYAGTMDDYSLIVSKAPVKSHKKKDKK